MLTWDEYVLRDWPLRGESIGLSGIPTQIFATDVYEVSFWEMARSALALARNDGDTERFLEIYYRYCRQMFTSA